VLAEKYIELLKNALLGELYFENELRIITAVAALADGRELSLDLIHDVRPQTELRKVLKESKRCGTMLTVAQRTPEGRFVPNYALRNYTELSHTLIGRARLDNIQCAIERILEDDVPGDLIETGVWRGGATIFMRGVLAAYGVRDRNVWVADSFDGVPAPSMPQDANFDFSKKTWPFLAVGLPEVKDLFDRYGLLDDQVRFLKGWFKDTLPTAPIARLALLRLDGDLYESTMDALRALYDKVSEGGFIIVDDYFSCPPCQAAADEFRAVRKISDPLTEIDEQSVFWRKRLAPSEP